MDHEEKKISCIVMIQSSHSSKRWYGNKLIYWQIDEFKYREIAFLDFHSKHMPMLIILNYSVICPSFGKGSKLLPRFFLFSQYLSWKYTLVQTVNPQVLRLITKVYFQTWLHFSSDEQPALRIKKGKDMIPFKLKGEGEVDHDWDSIHLCGFKSRIQNRLQDHKLEGI